MLNLNIVMGVNVSVIDTLLGVEERGGEGRGRRRKEGRKEGREEAKGEGKREIKNRCGGGIHFGQLISS